MRQALGAYYQQTLSLTAIFQSYGRTSEGSNVACFANIRHRGVYLEDHCWVHRSKQMKKLDLQHGDIIAFEARVGRYVRREPVFDLSEIEYDYRLEKIRDVRLLRRAKGANHE